MAVAAVLRGARRSRAGRLGELRVGGGGARLPLSGQLKAELLGLPVLHLDLDPAGFGVAMILEVIHPFEADDDQVLDDLRVSAEYWRQALAGESGSGPGDTA